MEYYFQNNSVKNSLKCPNVMDSRIYDVGTLLLNVTILYVVYFPEMKNVKSLLQCAKINSE